VPTKEEKGVNKFLRYLDGLLVWLCDFIDASADERSVELPHERTHGKAV
jgi:hypothetical protein